MKTTPSDEAFAAELRLAADRMESYRSLTSSSHGQVNEYFYSCLLREAAIRLTGRIQRDPLSSNVPDATGQLEAGHLEETSDE